MPLLSDCRLLDYNNNMFSSSIDNKANKIKLNVDSYLNERKKQQTSQQPVPSVRRPDQNSAPPLQSQPSPLANPGTSSSNLPNNQFKPVQFQLKQLILQAKTYDKPPITLKNIIKQKSITVFYSEEQVRYKLQIRATDNGLQMRINPDKASIEISFKKAVKYKFCKQENGQPKWMLTNQVRDDKVFILTNREGKTLKSFFEGVVPEECIKVETGQIKQQDKVSVIGEITEREEVQDAQDVVNFVMPTPQVLADTEKVRKAIKDMKEEEKVMILMDIFKIKREYEDNLSRKLKCPIHACQKTYREISQLKSHLKKHPQLNKHGIEFTEFGTYEYSNKAIDLALYLGKLYPAQVKKIIRKMKTKQAIE